MRYALVAQILIVTGRTLLGTSISPSILGLAAALITRGLPARGATPASSHLTRRWRSQRLVLAEMANGHHRRHVLRLGAD
jgi:hypothetical protein